MRSLTVPAPAKLNLFLHVTGRRADGYHLLETLFVALDVGDTITLTRARRRRDSSHVGDDPGVARAETISRFARRARCKRASGCACGVDIARRQSAFRSAAAWAAEAPTRQSVLLALNRLWALGMPRADLIAYRRRARRGRSVLPRRRARACPRHRRAPDAGFDAELLGRRDRAADLRPTADDLRGRRIDTRLARRRKWTSFPRVMGAMTCSRPRSHGFRHRASALAKLVRAFGGARMTGSGELRVRARSPPKPQARAAVARGGRRDAGLCRTDARATSAGGVRVTRGIGFRARYECAASGRRFSAGESPSWLRHRILIPAFEGSNPSSPATESRIHLPSSLTS